MKQSSLHVEQQLSLKSICEADLLAFSTYFFKVRTTQDFKVNWHHIKIADALMRLVRGEVPNLLITQPPGSSKTEIGVISFIAWSMARNAWSRFLHLSASAELAELNSATAREIIETEEYRALWGRQLRKDSKAKGRWNVQSDNKIAGGVYATSTGGQVTGFRAGYMNTEEFSGAIIIDDPLKAEDIWSKSRRQAQIRRLTNTIRSRRALVTTPIILIMQRLHEEDPAQAALSGAMGLEFEHIEIQAVSNENTPYEKSYWEFKESLESLNELKRVDPFTFSAQYQQRPTPVGGALIKEDWISEYTGKPEVSQIGIFVDTAQKDGDKNDFSVFLLAGTDGYDLFILDVVRKKLQSPDLVDEAISFYNRHKPNRLNNNVHLKGFFVEDKVSGTGLIQTIKQKTSIPVIPIPRNIDKLTRVIDTLPYFRSGRVKLPEAAPWKADFVQELLSFSPMMTHRHDDQVDCLSDAVQELLNPKSSILSGGDFS